MIIVKSKRDLLKFSSKNPLKKIFSYFFLFSMDDQYEKINSFPQLNAYVEDKWYTFSDDGCF